MILVFMFSLITIFILLCSTILSLGFFIANLANNENYKKSLIAFIIMLILLAIAVIISFKISEAVW